MCDLRVSFHSRSLERLDRGGGSGDGCSGGGGQALADDSAGATPGCLNPRRVTAGAAGGDAGSALMRVSSGTICRHPCHPLALDDGNESELTRVVPSGAGVHGEVTARATTNNVVKSVAAK